MIVVVDYGAGNLKSVVNAFEAINQTTCVTSDPADLAQAAAIILPGVGAFGAGMECLKRLELIAALTEQVLGAKKPYLGICLGLQFLADQSFEQGQHQGLGWIAGTVERIVPSSTEFRIPHMGWNSVQLEQPCPLFDGLEAEPVFYFVHSYYLQAVDATVVTGRTFHSIPLTASVQRDNIFGVQFHPEKSQYAGLQVLKNFVKLL